MARGRIDLMLVDVVLGEVSGVDLIRAPGRGAGP